MTFSDPSFKLAWDLWNHPQGQYQFILDSYYQDGQTPANIQFAHNFVEYLVGQAITHLLESPQSMIKMHRVTQYLNNALNLLPPNVFSYAAILLKENILYFFPHFASEFNSQKINQFVTVFFVTNMPSLSYESKELLMNAFGSPQSFSHFYTNHHQLHS